MNKLMILAVAFLLTSLGNSTFAQERHPLVDNRTVALWLFDSPLGGTVVDETSGGNDLKTSVPLETLKSRSGNAYNFDKNTINFLRASKSLNIYDSGKTGNKPFTFEIWCRLTSVPANHYGIVYEHSRYTKSGWRFGFKKDLRPVFLIENSADKKEEGITGPKLKLNQWYHLAAVYTGKEMRLYVDGKLVKSRAYDGVFTENKNMPKIASGFGAGNYYFDGDIDAMRISRGVRNDFSREVAAKFPPSTKKMAKTNNWFDAYRPTKNYQDLGGLWEARPMPGEKNFPEEVPKDKWRRIILPVENPFAKIKPDADFNFFRKKFKVSDDLKKKLKAGEKAFLHFGGNSFRWQARLNGKIIIDTLDAFNPREIDVSELIKIDGENELILGTSSRYSLMAEDLSEEEKRAPKGRSRMISPAGHAGKNYSKPVIGVWGEIELWARPKRRIEDCFIQSSFRNKTLTATLELVGAGNDLLELKVFDAGGKFVLESKPKNVIVTPKWMKKIDLCVKWDDPILWEPENPYLYRAEITLKDKDSGKLLDSRSVPFGFREIWIDGENLMMNGKRLFLARTSLIPRKEVDAVKTIKRAMSRNANSLRMHLGGFYRPSPFAAEADKKGLMLVPEAQFVAPISYRLKDLRFWKSYRDILRRWVKNARNHPSIIMWSLSNEILWCHANKQNPDSARLLHEGGLGVKEIDPTRPVQYDGDADLPKEGLCETVSLHYPWEPLERWYPTECWAFENPDLLNPPKIRWVGNFHWTSGEKPITVGEYCWNSKGYTAAPAPMTKFAGDKAYDWKYWSTWELYRQLIKWQTDAWRVARFAGLNPWYPGDKYWHKLMPLETVILKTHTRTFFSEEDVELEAFLLNDTLRDRSYTVEWKLTENGNVVDDDDEGFSLDGGEMEQFKLDFTIPEIEKPTNYNLEVRVERDGKIVNSETYEIKARPIEKISVPDNTVLLDPDGKTTDLFAKLAIKVKSVQNIGEAEKSKNIILGFGALAKLSLKQRKSLLQAISKGKNVLMMGETRWPETGFALTGVGIEKYPANYAWIRAKGHPALKGINDKDLSLWCEGDWVADFTLEKPVENEGVGWRALIDIGSTSGLSYIGLMELFYGSGRIVLNQLNLSKALKDPGARALLKNLIETIDLIPNRKAFALLPKNAKSVFKDYLKEMNIPTQVWTPRSPYSTLFIAAGNKSLKPAALSQWVKNGGKVVVQGLNSSNLPTWAKLVPGLKVFPCDPPDGCLLKAGYPLTWGISSEELFWSVGNWTERRKRIASSPSDRHGTIRLTPIANFAISGTNVEPLTDPAAFVKVPDGKGCWIFSSVNFDKGKGYATASVYRFIQNLFVNLGLAPSLDEVIKFVDFKPINLAAVVNRGYEDDAEGNGSGGWTDQGEADLRYFPVNRTGLDEGGLPMPIPDFPDKIKLVGVEYSLVDPEKNNGKSCLMLEPNYKRLPSVVEGDYVKEAKGIPVNRKFDRLYSLHSAAWAQAATGAILWSYVLHYEDGSTKTLPVRMGMETGDWYNPRSLSNAKVVWKGSSKAMSPVGLYSTAFDNPNPKKTVKSIDIISGKNVAIPGIIALTTAIKKVIKQK